MMDDDTIVAFSSVAAPSARIIIRLSGSQAMNLLNAISSDTSTASLGASLFRPSIGVHGVRFPAWAYAFTAPRSYTGENVVELHLPGNVLLARWTMEELIRRGARPAQPGEFTARAYFNGRMDLSEAEGVAAVIAASSDQQLQAARQLLAGELARRLNPIMDQLAQTLALTEVGIDFADEDVIILSHEQTRARIDAIAGQLHSLVADSSRFAQLAHEPRVVLAGRPNAGKSTLLNALSGQARAVVSQLAGTTRDLLSAQVMLHGGSVTLIDAAGLEDGQPDPTADAIALAMRGRALTAVEQADILVLVRDAADDRPLITLSRSPDLIVLSKADLPHPTAAEPQSALLISAHGGQGMDKLRAVLSDMAFGQTRSGQSLALNDRHLAAIAEAQTALDRALHAMEAGAELVALELREALDALGTILGATAPDELLGRIFSTFCIGK